MVEGFMLRRLTVSEVYSQTYAVFRKRAELFIIIAAMSYVLLVIIMAPTMQVATSGDAKDREMHESAGLAMLEQCIYLIVNAVGHAAMSRAVAEVYVGRIPILHECLLQGLQVCCNLLGAWALLLGVLLVSGFIVVVVLAIVFGILTGGGGPSAFFGFLMYLSMVAIFMAYGVIISLITPTAMIEKQGPLLILRRAYDFAKENFMFILFTNVGLSLVYVIVDAMLARLFFGGDADATYSMAGLMVTKLTNLVFAPLMSIMHTLVYFSIRIEREGLNADVLASELDSVQNSTFALPERDTGYISVSLGGEEPSGQRTAGVPLMDTGANSNTYT